MKNFYAIVGAALLLAVCTFPLWGPSVVNADQGYVSSDDYGNATRACDLTAVTAQKVTTSGTSAATTSTTGKGRVRVTCSARAFMATGVSGVTASTGGSHAIPANVPEYFWTKGGYKFAFVQDTGAGVCEVGECK